MRNRHFLGCTHGGASVFVTAYTEPGSWERTIAAAPLAETALTPARTPKLLDHGHHADSVWSTVHAWLDLTELAPTPAKLAAAGALLGSLHHATRGITEDCGLQRHDLDEEIRARAPGSPTMTAPRQIASSGSIGPGASRIAAKAPSSFMETSFGRTSPPTPKAPSCSTTLKTPDSAHRCWTSSSSSTAHSPTATPGLVDAFLDGYYQRANPMLPWPDGLRHARLWATTGVLAYAHQHTLPDLARHAHQVLHDLEQT